MRLPRAAAGPAAQLSPGDLRVELVVNPKP
jgi:hypothetical protein